MRVTRSVFLILAAAIAAAGCARQPAPWVPMAAAPAMATPTAAVMASGIDTMVYGSPAPAAPCADGCACRGAGGGQGILHVGRRSSAVTRLCARAGLCACGGRLRRRAAGQPYTLDSGDRLRIVVFGQDGLSNSYVVDASGYIAMPLIGTVLARGATTEQLSSRIAGKLSQGFIKEPHLAVEIEAYRPFFILGEVTQPGQYPYVADMTVETAVAIAGGFGPRAYRKTVMRHANDQWPAGAGDRSDELQAAARRHGECAGAVVLAGEQTTDVSRRMRIRPLHPLSAVRPAPRLFHVLGEKRHRALPGELGRRFLVTAALVAVEAVLGIRIDVDFAIAAALLLDEVDVAHRD